MLTVAPAAPLILLVEDDEDHAELIRVSLLDAVDAYRLEITGSVSAARAAIARRMPDIVLSDYRLPDGDGSELVTTLSGHCPLILLTSQGNEQEYVEDCPVCCNPNVVHVEFDPEWPEPRVWAEAE